MELWTLYLSSLWKEYACQIGSSTQASLVNIKLKPHHLRWMFAWKNPPLHPSFRWKNAFFFLEFLFEIWVITTTRNQWIPEAGNISHGNLRKIMYSKSAKQQGGKCWESQGGETWFLVQTFGGGGVSFSPWLLVLGIATSRYIINVKM